MKYLLLLALLYSPVNAKVSENQVVASVIILEAGGEGEAGMRAVAAVIQNRMGRKSAYKVVTTPKHFSCFNGYAKRQDEFVNRAAKHPRYALALTLAKEIASKRVADNTGKADHYHTTDVHPYWAPKMTFTKKIGNHLFYKSS
jgi:N-acetylmuramoyl-L-alanine amidase